MHEDPRNAIDWASARDFLVGAVRARWYHDPSAVDDLVQECLVRLVRASRRGPIDNTEALMNEIARRTIIDKLRSNTRMAVIFDSGTEMDLEQAASATRPPDEFGDPLARIRFVVLNYFRGTKCAELAQAFFQEMHWDKVAEQLSTSHAAIRKQWQRCVDRLRAVAGKDPSLVALADWV